MWRFKVGSACASEARRSALPAPPAPGAATVGRASLRICLEALLVGCPPPAITAWLPALPALHTLALGRDDMPLRLPHQVSRVVSAPCSHASASLHTPGHVCVCASACWHTVKAASKQVLSLGCPATPMPAGMPAPWAGGRRA